MLEYQQKIDTARVRLDSCEITKKELNALKSELAESMPDAVRAKLGDDAPKLPNDMPKVAADNDMAALPSDMDSLMRNTGFAPSSPGGR